MGWRCGSASRGNEADSALGEFLLSSRFSCVGRKAANRNADLYFGIGEIVGADQRHDNADDRRLSMAMRDIPLISRVEEVHSSPNALVRP